MRIIDKNTDFYDCCQNMYRDNSLTFDRTDSFKGFLLSMMKKASRFIRLAENDGLCGCIIFENCSIILF